MKKILAIGLAAALSVTLLAGCGGGDGDNTPPTITGVPETAQTSVGEVWDALEGVTATDKEDGDLTSKIKVTCNNSKVTITEDGKVTASEARSATRPYTITYTVTDSKGEEAKKECALAVQEATAKQVNVYESNFADVTPTWHDWSETDVTEGNNHWWKLEKNTDNDQNKTPEATASLEEGMLKVDVTDLKGLGDDKLMLTRHFNDLEIGTYKFVVWIKSSVNIKINLQAILDDSSAKNTSWDGKALGNYDEDNYYTNEKDVPHGLFGAEVGTSFKAVEFDFSITQKKIVGERASVLFRIALGGNDNPDAFKVDIEKIFIDRTTGEKTVRNLIDKSTISSVDDLGLTIKKSADGAENGVATSFAAGAAKIDISKYNTSEGCWSIIATIAFTVAIDTTKTYGYEIEIKADSPYNKAEIHCGNSLAEGDGDKWYSGDIGEIGTEYRTLSHTFKFDSAYSQPGLHLFLGKQDGSPSADTNTFYIKSFRFFEVTGEPTTSAVAKDKFVAFGDQPVSVFNRSDDDYGHAAMGTAYFENNKLVYLIHEGGNDQGHNKLQIGNWDTVIGPLPANAYYVVSFTIKASVELDFALALHDLEDGTWDEASGCVPLRYADFGGHELLHAGVTEKHYELVTTQTSLTARDKWELLFEFGKFLNGNKEVKIEISDVKIGYRAVQD